MRSLHSQKRARKRQPQKRQSDFKGLRKQSLFIHFKKGNVLKLLYKSPVTDITYCPADSVHIVNPKQILFYICLGVTIQDVFPSLNYDNGEKVLVFCVDKKESQSAYRAWMNNEKLDASVLDGFEIPEEDPDEVRILNLRQVIFYLSNQAVPLRMVPMLDKYTGEPVLAFAFSKKDTAEIYGNWKKIKAYY